MLKRIKGFSYSLEAKVALMAAVVMVTGLSGTASAALDQGISDAFSAGFTGMASDAVAMIAVIVPIAIGLAGTIFLVKKAMSWFKGVAK